MADISNMTTKQNTAKLCALVGWWVLHDQRDERGGIEYYRSWLADSHEQPILSDNKAIDWDSRRPRSLDYSDFVDLYAEKHMALAWRVVTEINRQWENGEDWSDGFFTWWNDAELWRLTADEAQAAWLDKILELATEAELV
jgi:hypothetical protein